MPPSPVRLAREMVFYFQNVIGISETLTFSAAGPLSLETAVTPSPRYLWASAFAVRIA